MISAEHANKMHDLSGILNETGPELQLPHFHTAFASLFLWRFQSEMGNLLL